MRPDLEKIVPGLAEARAAEEAARAVAFLDEPQTLLGVKVRMLTLGAAFELAESGNHLISGRAGTHAMITRFLWRVSPRFCRPGSLAWIFTSGYRRRLRRHVAKFSPIEASVTIREWVLRQKQDEPPVIIDGDEDKKPAEQEQLGFHGLASLVDFFAESYGWSQAETLDKPIARLWQLYRANMRRKGCKVPLCPPSDRIKRDWYNEMRALKKARQSAKKNTA